MFALPMLAAQNEPQLEKPMAWQMQTMHERKERMDWQQEDAPCQRAQTMELRQEDMQERMKMMQMMMQQMMEHLSVQA